MRKFINIINEELSDIFFHGTNKTIVGDFIPSDRGFFGPGFYGSLNQGVSKNYGNDIIPFKVNGDIFQAYPFSKGTLYQDKGAEDRILSVMTPEEREKVLDWKSWYKDDSAAFWEALSRRIGKNRAVEILQLAGYAAIEGIGDGHEVCVFDPKNVAKL